MTFCALVEELASSHSRYQLVSARHAWVSSWPNFLVAQLTALPATGRYYKTRRFRLRGSGEGHFQGNLGGAEVRQTGQGEVEAEQP